VLWACIEAHVDAIIGSTMTPNADTRPCFEGQDADDLDGGFGRDHRARGPKRT
jgi:hypothetical protein